MTLHMNKSELQQRVKMWGVDLVNEDHVRNVFVKYVNGEIPSLPWCDQQLNAESNLIRNQLIKINKLGYLSINSQPAVNGALSSDEIVGWGPKGGFIYQKAYVEFFVSPNQLQPFLKSIQKFPSLTYHAVNLKGEEMTNAPKNHANALTWGVFPGKEILQPTVVDTDSFIAWKDEAFSLWKTSWLSLYPSDSTSHKVLENVINTYYLVNLVENNYVTGDIFAVFTAAPSPSSDAKQEQQ